MKKLFMFLLLSTSLTTVAWGQFYQMPEDVPEEEIYPGESYESEMGYQQQEEMMYPPAEVLPGDEYMQEEQDMYYHQDSEMVEEL